MTRSRSVLFDTWAWHEVLDGTAKGEALRREYLEDASVDVYTADLTLIELSCKLVARGLASKVPAALDRVISDSTEVLAVTRDDAVDCGTLRAELRKTTKEASCVDAAMLNMARRRGARLVSCDAAFKGQPGVACAGWDPQ